MLSCASRTSKLLKKPRPFGIFDGTGHKVKSKGHEYSTGASSSETESLKTTPKLGQKYLAKTTDPIPGNIIEWTLEQGIANLQTPLSLQQNWTQLKGTYRTAAE